MSFLLYVDGRFFSVAPSKLIHSKQHVFDLAAVFPLSKRSLINKGIKSLDKSQNSITSNDETHHSSSWFFYFIVSSASLFVYEEFFPSTCFVHAPPPLLNRRVDVCNRIWPVNDKTGIISSRSLKIHAFHYHLFSFGVCYTCVFMSSDLLSFSWRQVYLGCFGRHSQCAISNFCHFICNKGKKRRGKPKSETSSGYWSLCLKCSLCNTQFCRDSQLLHYFFSSSFSIQLEEFNWNPKTIAYLLLFFSASLFMLPILRSVMCFTTEHFVNENVPISVCRKSFILNEWASVYVERHIA